MLCLNNMRIFILVKEGMPRGKRRVLSNTNHNHTSVEMSPSAHEEGLPRHPSKRLRQHTPR